MTLTLRNRTLLIFCGLSVCFILFLATGGISAALQGTLSVNEAGVRPIRIPESFFLLSYDFIAVIIAIAVLTLYVPLTLIRVYVTFEKTQAPEIVYFCSFLFVCILEGLRFVVFIFGLWETFTPVLHYCMRAVLFARILGSLTFLVAAVFSNSKTKRESHQNVGALYAVSIILALNIPLITTEFKSNGMIAPAYQGSIVILQTFIALVTAGLFLLTSLKGERGNYKYVASGFLILYTGYTLLCMADCYLPVILGAPMLVAGTRLFLNSLHRHYLWK